MNYIWKSGTNQLSLMLLASSNYSVFNVDITSNPTTPVFAYTYTQSTSTIYTSPSTYNLNSFGLPGAIYNSTSTVFYAVPSTSTSGSVIYSGTGAYVVPALANTTNNSPTLVVDPTGKTALQTSTATGSATNRLFLQVFELAQ